jgi:hypothetical protein
MMVAVVLKGSGGRGLKSGGSRLAFAGSTTTRTAVVLLDGTPPCETVPAGTVKLVTIVNGPGGGPPSNRVKVTV